MQPNKSHKPRSLVILLCVINLVLLCAIVPSIGDFILGTQESNKSTYAHKELKVHTLRLSKEAKIDTFQDCDITVDNVLTVTPMYSKLTISCDLGIQRVYTSITGYFDVIETDTSTSIFEIPRE